MKSIEESGQRQKRRPNYPLEFKRQLAEKACAEDVSVAQLALEHGLNANMVFRWRRQLRAGQLDEGAVLLPVALAPATPMPPASKGGPGLIEIRIGDAVVRVEGAPDAGTLGAVLRSLQR
ncbi:MAG TPA: transposase [Pseudomonas sp.]|uniref:IS66-like element accessory protein TnpA n=1 Tax=Pseudomonas sp. TaxID=306 RepID=UPI002C275F42|nr:transposase [Pseudomonas sp.]HSX88788.1 transposase [Pseudomonas sp.]